MKKRVFSLIFVFLLLLLFSTISFAARGIKIQLDEPGEYDIIVSKTGDGDYESIQYAIDNAKEGDIIFVREGKYEESLYVEIDGIKLIGEGQDKVEIISKDSDPAITIDGVSDVEVSGFTFIYNPEEKDSGNTCVWIKDARDVSFHDNFMTGATYSGLEISGGEDLKIYNNLSKGNKESGFFINSGARHILFYDNIGKENRYHGLEVSEEDTAPIVYNNKFLKNKQSGMYVHDFATPLIRNNLFSENTHSGISISRDADPIVISNILLNNKEDGIYMYKNAKGRIISNISEGNGISGITITNSSPFVYNNVFQNNKQFGIDIYTKPGDDSEARYSVTIVSNTIKGNGYSGIGVGGSLTYVVIYQNTLYNNKEDGFLVYEGAEAKILHNLIVGSGLNGIETRKSAYTYATNNTIVGNQSGIYTHSNGYGLYMFNIVAFNEIGIRYKEREKEMKIDHFSNIYWKNEKTTLGMDLSDKDIEDDPGFVDPDKGNYKLKIDSKYKEWGY